MEVMPTLEEYAGGSLEEVVANYEWRPADDDGRSYGVLIKIRVHKDSHGSFFAHASHRVKTPRQIAAYMPSGSGKDTIEEAVRYCIGGFKMFMGTARETEWHEIDVL